MYDLQSGNVTTLPTSWDMFCNSMSIMQDGRVLINGGTKVYGQLGIVGQTQDVPFTGLPNSAIFDPASDSFVSAPSTAHGRWYPTVNEMGDGRMMTTSGLNDTDGSNNNTTEIWDGQSWGAEIPGQPNISDFPGFQFPLYPRMHLLPTGHIFYSAPSSSTLDFDPSTSTWTLVAWTIYPGLNDPNGERTYGTSVLLPLTPQNNYNAKVMIMGGDNPATNTTELMDFSDAGQAACLNSIGYAPCWQQGPAMVQARVEMQATILPNGKVLVDSGSGQDEDASTASLKAEIYDPVSNTVFIGGIERLSAPLSQCAVVAARWHRGSDGRQSRPGSGASGLRAAHRNLHSLIFVQFRWQPGDPAGHRERALDCYLQHSVHGADDEYGYRFGRTDEGGIGHALF